MTTNSLYKKVIICLHNVTPAIAFLLSILISMLAYVAYLDPRAVLIMLSSTLIIGGVFLLVLRIARDVDNWVDKEYEKIMDQEYKTLMDQKDTKV